MKQAIYSALILAIALLTNSCNEGFGTWRKLNEDWLAEKSTTLGKGDPDIIETRVLPSGVLIEVYHNGFGAIPKPSVDPSTEKSSTVVVAYKGLLIDGTEFDSSEETSMSLSNTIPGWQEALSQMRQGSSWRIYIPYSEGYDDEGSKDWADNFVVPPYSTLIFDIDLIDVINY